MSIGSLPNASPPRPGSARIMCSTTNPLSIYLADVPPPTRYILLPVDITARELAAEVRRIMSLRPYHIVVTDSPVVSFPPEVHDIVEGELARSYALDSEFIDSITAEHVRLYRR